jgi:hypothetical protein
MSGISMVKNRHVSLCEALDCVLNTGIVAGGKITISVAEVDLIFLGLQLILTSIKNTGETRNPPDESNLLEGGASRGPPAAIKPAAELPAGQALSRPARPLEPRRAPAGNSEWTPNSASHAGSFANREGGSRVTPEGEPATRAASSLRKNIDPGQVKNGLGQLVLTLVKLLHELLERQALRRMETGSLDPAEIERLGITLMEQAQEIERLRQAFGLEPGDLNLDLGPLGKLM